MHTAFISSAAFVAYQLQCVVCIHSNLLTTMASKENCPPEKRRKLSLTLSRRQRFGETSREEILALEKVQVPKNTEVTTKWALRNLNDWFKDYQERNPDCPCLKSILTPSASKDDLNKYLTIYRKSRLLGAYHC